MAELEETIRMPRAVRATTTASTTESGACRSRASIGAARLPEARPRGAPGGTFVTPTVRAAAGMRDAHGSVRHACPATRGVVGKLVEARGRRAEEQGGH